MVDDLKDRETRLEATNRSLHQKILELESKLEESKGTVPRVAGSREELELKLSESNKKINQLSETVHKKEIEMQGMYVGDYLLSLILYCGAVCASLLVAPHAGSPSRDVKIS